MLSCNQSSSLFSGLLSRFRYSPIERFFYKFDGIDCCPKLNAKRVNRLIHRCWQVPPPVNSAAHRFFDSCYHLIDGDVAVGLRHSLASHFGAAVHGGGWHLVWPADFAKPQYPNGIVSSVSLETNRVAMRPR